MVQMVVKGRRPIHIDGRQFKPGETFEASEVDARYYRRRDMADNAPVVVVPPKTQKPPQRVVAPDAPKPEAPVSAVPAVAPTVTLDAPIYQRRDMRAED